MDLLKTTLLIVLLTTISAMPRGSRRHHDADIPEQKMLHAFNQFIRNAFKDEDSSESPESKSSSEESKSSEEIIIPDVTTPVVITPAVTTPAVTTPAVTTPAVTQPAVTQPAVTSPAMTTVEEGSTATPEVGTIDTDQPIVMETTLSPETPTPSASVTTTCDQCFTVVIPTGAPITDNRGDN
ncbi:probable serine/threonine-protein kinase DDB_G0286627 [Archocentrus centrarchus]|uniref:probable serine/threonine-protein kinase DDB_G0286627 n=1 Tax=Archocentrus centrarchus TaxID=63155 RepID=UPI0011EA08ED|nr:probable serine/threonine-protein kinase DDB_G0286627 [Archocentrus centrarchus]